MRISDLTTKVIINLCQKHFGKDVPVRLFGSRVNNQSRGGDIDIHVIAPKSSFKDEISFLADIEAILDERVDIRVQKYEFLLIDQVALKNGVLLNG